MSHDAPEMPPGPTTRGPAPPQLQVTDRRRTPPWVFIMVVALVLAVWWLAGRVIDLGARVDTLESNVAAVETTFVPVAQTTVPVPLDIPPADAETARRQISDALGAVFSSELSAEQRTAWVRDPADLVGRFAVLESGPCASDTAAVITELRFQGNDTGWVRIRFEGAGVPDFGGSITFDGLVHRAPDRWVLDHQLVDEVLTMAAPYCD